MGQKIRFVIPCAQLGIGVVLAEWQNLTKNSHTSDFYIQGFREALLQLNYPWFAVWSYVLGVFQFGDKAYPGMRPPSETIELWEGLSLLVCFFVFWYFIVAELQIQRTGQTKVRVAGHQWVVLKVIMFSLWAIALFYSTYSYGLRMYWAIPRSALRPPSGFDTLLWRVEVSIWASIRIAWGLFFLWLVYFYLKGGWPKRDPIENSSLAN
jgi:hypothetical protein